MGKYNSSIGGLLFDVVLMLLESVLTYLRETTLLYEVRVIHDFIYVASISYYNDMLPSNTY